MPTSPPRDALVAVVVRLYDEFADKLPLTMILGVVHQCRLDLDAGSGPVGPDRIESLAHERLLANVAARAGA